MAQGCASTSLAPPASALPTAHGRLLALTFGFARDFRGPEGHDISLHRFAPQHLAPIVHDAPSGTTFVRYQPPLGFAW